MSYVELQEWRDRLIDMLEAVLNNARAGYYVAMLNMVVEYTLRRYMLRPITKTDEEIREAVKIHMEVNKKEKEIFDEVEEILKSRERGKSIHLS